MRSFLYPLEVRIQQWIPAWMFQVRLQELYVLPLLSLPVESPASSLQLFRATQSPRDLELLASQCGKNILDQRLAQKGCCYLAISAGRLMGIVWFAFDSYRDIDTSIDFRLNGDQAWLYGAWVARDFRRNGIYRQLLQRASSDLASEGIRQFMLAIDMSNSASRRAHRRLGATRRGTCWGGKLFGCGGYRVVVNSQTQLGQESERSHSIER
jgi:RimJ/RimL family protein N-acetyltransferase